MGTDPIDPAPGRRGCRFGQRASRGFHYDRGWGNLKGRGGGRGWWVGGCGNGRIFSRFAERVLVVRCLFEDSFSEGVDALGRLRRVQCCFLLEAPPPDNLHLDGGVYRRWIFPKYPWAAFNPDEGTRDGSQRPSTTHGSRRGFGGVGHGTGSLLLREGRADKGPSRRRCRVELGRGGADNLRVSPTVLSPGRGGAVSQRGRLSPCFAWLSGGQGLAQGSTPACTVERARLTSHHISLEVIVRVFQIEGAGQAQPSRAISVRRGEEEANAVIGRSFFAQLAENLAVDILKFLAPPVPKLCSDSEYSIGRPGILVLLAEFGYGRFPKIQRVF